MKKLVKRSISVALVFLLLINVIVLSNPFDKVYASSLDQNKYLCSLPDPKITSLSLSPTAKVESLQSVISNKMVNSIESSTSDVSTTGEAINLASSKILLPNNIVITDSVMHPSQPIIYITDKTNKKVYSINYDTMQTAEISFSDPPESIAFSDNEIYVALLKGEHSYTWWKEDQKGAIAVINANTFTIKEQFDINLDPSEIIIGRDDYIYVISGSGQWTNINSYSKLTKELKGSATIREGSSAELHNNYDRIYTIEHGGSVVINTFDFVNGAISNRIGANDVYGAYDLSGNFRLSPDGRYMFNSTGVIFHCDIDKTKDVKYAFTLDKSFTDISFDLTNNRFFTAIPGKAIRSYDYNTFNGISIYSSEGEIKNLYYRDNMLIALSKTDNGDYIIEKINASSGENLPSAIVTKIQLQKNANNFELNYSVDNSAIDPLDSAVYITDSTNNKIASVNFETGEAKEVNTYYSPGRILYYNNKLYIGYGKQGKIEIYDAPTLDLKDVIYTGATFRDFNIGNDGYIYASSNRYLRCYSITSKQEVSKFDMLVTGYLESHPILNSMYMTSADTSSPNLSVLNYVSGSLMSKYDSIYNGFYTMSYNNRISPDGKYIFNGSGNIYMCSSDKSKNMIYCGTIGKDVRDVTFDAENNKFYTAIFGNSIYAYNYLTFKQIESYPTRGAVKKLYTRDGKLIAISATSQGSYIIETINTVQSTDPSGMINNVRINQISTTSYAITWDTEELTSSQVEYGLTQKYGETTAATDQVKKHSVIINNLSPNTMYHFKIHSNSDAINIVSDDIKFVTEDFPSIALGTSINRIVYSSLLNKAYAIDNKNMKLLVIDLEKHILESTIDLSKKPDDLCLSEDSLKLYIVNFDGTVSEFSTETFSKVRDISSTLLKDDSTNVHFHIKCKSGKLYLVDGSWAPTVWSMDLNSLSLTQISNVNRVGDVVFSKNSDYLYSWYQYGWSAGWPGSYIQKYKVENSDISSSGTSKSDYPTGMQRDPLDSPIILLEEQNRLLTKNKVFDTNNLKELNTFTEDIYAVSLDGIFAASKKGVYKLSDYKKAADTTKNESDILFYDNNRNLYYVVNGQARIYYDNRYAMPVQGDINDDGAVNALDFALLKEYLLGNTTNINKINADMNLDQVINAIDFALLKKLLLR